MLCAVSIQPLLYKLLLTDDQRGFGWESLSTATRHPDMDKDLRGEFVLPSDRDVGATLVSQDDGLGTIPLGDAID